MSSFFVIFLLISVAVAACLSIDVIAQPGDAWRRSVSKRKSTWVAIFFVLSPLSWIAVGYAFRAYWNGDRQLVREEQRRAARQHPDAPPVGPASAYEPPSHVVYRPGRLEVYRCERCDGPVDPPDASRCPTCGVELLPATTG